MSESVVYFAIDRAVMLMKVGTTSNEERRKRELQTGNGRRFEWLGSFPGGKPEERRLHLALSDWDGKSRQQGEWFQVTHEIVDIVRNIVSDNERAELLAQLETTCDRVRHGTPFKSP